MLFFSGQFRHQAMKDVPVLTAVESGRQLASHHNCFVHMFEVNTVTCGEFFIEITNTQLGMENLHSVVQCAAGISASVFSCVEEEGLEVTLTHCSHALGVYHVAAEEGSLDATAKREFPPPGSLRVCFIDRLQQMEEIVVRLSTLIVKHNQAPER